VSVATGGTQGDDNSYAPRMSADGRYVVFYSYASTLVAGDTNGWADVFVHDRDDGARRRGSAWRRTGTEGDWDSSEPAISADGRYVVFSRGPAPGGGRHQQLSDVFVHDRATGPRRG